MTTRLATDDITLALGSTAVCLRPSLRAAIKLDRLGDGFPNLIKSIIEGNLTTIREIILAAATDRKAAIVFLSYAGSLKPFLDAVTAPLFLLCTAFSGDPVADSDSQASASTGAPVSWSQSLHNLYVYATGWLGWTPEAALDATPFEIMDAYTGLIDYLNFINGGARKDRTPEAYTKEPLAKIDADGADPAFDRNAFQALKNKMSGDF